MVSVILLYWKRPAIFEDIIKTFLAEEKVDEIIVFDNSGKFKTDLPVTIINSSKNYGAGIRMNIVSLAKNDCIVFCDDDMLPKKGIVDDLYRYYEQHRFVGTHGKIFPDYFYLEKITARAEEVTEPTPVDYLCCNLVMIDRNLIKPLDLNETDIFYIDDIWLSYKLRKQGMQLLVIPTKNFTITKHNLDNNALLKNKDSLNARVAFLKTWRDNLPSVYKP